MYHFGGHTERLPHSWVTLYHKNEVVSIMFFCKKNNHLKIGGYSNIFLFYLQSLDCCNENKRDDSSF